MAKITITIEDRDGSVKVDSHPNMKTMVQMSLSGEARLTPGHQYAIKMLERALAYSAEMSANKRKRDEGKLIVSVGPEMMGQAEALIRKHAKRRMN